MKEICIHGRGGQGSLVLAQFMAIAALEDGKFGLAFPFLGGGGERRGKPIVAYCRLDDRPIRLRSRVAEADYLIVQDKTIFNEVNLLEGLKPEGLVLVNSEAPAAALGIQGTCIVHTFAAEALARRILGRPIMNTALLGAFAALTQELSMDAVAKAVMIKFSGKLGERNVQVASESYELVSKELKA